MSSQQAPPHLVQRMQEKQQELEQLLVLRQLATHLQTHFDELSDKFDGLMQGNQGNKASSWYSEECDPITCGPRRRAYFVKAGWLFI